MSGATTALDNLASVAMNANLQRNNASAYTLNIAATANTVVGRALTISAGSTVTAGTADMAGGDLSLNSGLGKGTGASNIIFSTGRTLTTGSTLQTLTEAARITGEGILAVGTGSSYYAPVGNLQHAAHFNTNANGYGGAYFTTFNNTSTFGGFFLIGRGRGTLASPSAAQDGDFIGSITFAGQRNNTSDPTTLSTAANISVVAVGAFGASNSAGNMIFSTTPSGTLGVPVERMRLTSAGAVLIGGSIPASTTSLFEVIAAGASANPAFGAACYSSTIGSNAYFSFNKSHSDTSGTLLQTVDTDVLGTISFQGVLTGNTLRTASYIRSIQTGAAGASNVPAMIGFYTSDGTNAAVERMRILSSGEITIGSTSYSYNALYKVQINASAASAGFMCSVWSTTASHVPILNFLKSASSTVGTFLGTGDGEYLGTNQYNCFNSSNTAATAAEFRVEQDGAGGATYVPGRFVWQWDYLHTK